MSKGHPLDKHIYSVLIPISYTGSYQFQPDFVILQEEGVSKAASFSAVL